MDRRIQPLNLAFREGWGEPLRVNTGAIQALINVDVAKSSDETLIKEERFHPRPAAPGEPRAKGLQREFGRSGVWTEFDTRPIVIQLVDGHQSKPGEVADIRDVETAAVFKLENKVC